MKQPPTNICPLLAIAGAGGTNNPAVCIEGRCAWWDFCGSECAAVTATAVIREVAENLEALTAKSQALGNLDKKTAPSAANTESGKGTPNDH